MPESLDALKRSPLAGLSVEHFQGQFLIHAVGSSTYNKHKWTNEQTAMLVSCGGIAFFRSTHPIPTASTMSSQAPTVTKRIIVQSSPSENHDHSTCSSSSAKGSRVINSGHWEIALTLDLRPGKWRLGDVENPAVINAPISDVSSEYHQEGLRVRKSVTVSLTRSAIPDVDHVPDADALTDVKMEEIVRSESSRPSCASVDNHLIGLDADCSVRCPGGW